MSGLSEVEQVVTTVTERVGPAVVSINAGRGAGVVLDKGWVVTNAHNVEDTETMVTFADGRQAVARVIGIDVDGDVAVLSTDTGDIEPVAWRPANAHANGQGIVQVGASVFAVAPGGRGPRVTWGLVSSVGLAFRGPRGRRITGSIEHTAPLARGSSGGPVVDQAGQLVGINTNRLGDGFYLALPADGELKARIDALAQGHEPTRRFLGVALAPPRIAHQLRRAVGLPERHGLLVRAVAEASPAARAGLRQGDLIVAIGGHELTGVDQLYDAVDRAAQTEAGTLTLGIVRGTGDLDRTVTFGLRETEEKENAKEEGGSSS